MKADLAAGQCVKNGKPTGVNSLTGTGATQPSPQASYAPSLAGTMPMQKIALCISRSRCWILDLA